MKMRIMDCEDAVRQSVQPSRITSGSQSDIDRQDLIKQYANDSYLAKIACDSDLSRKDIESRGSLDVLDDELQKLATTEFDRLSLLSYSSARAGTVHASHEVHPSLDLPLWRGYGETVYFDPLNAHAMKIRRPHGTGSGSTKLSPRASRDVRNSFQSHLEKSATSRKSGKISRTSKESLPSGRTNLGSLRIGSKARRGKRVGSYFFPVEKREKICKGYSENTLPENVKTQLKAQKETLPTEELQISGCGETFPIRSSSHSRTRRDRRLPNLHKDKVESSPSSSEGVEIASAEPEQLEGPQGTGSAVNGGPQKASSHHAGSKSRKTAAANGNKSTEWKSPKCILIIPFASQEFDSTDDEKDEEGPADDQRAVSLESINVMSPEDRGMISDEAGERGESKAKNNTSDSKVKDEVKFKLTADLIPTHQHNNQNWIVSLYQKHLQEVGFRLPREKVNSASLRSNLKTTSTCKGFDENKDLATPGAAEKDPGNGAGGGKMVPKLAYTTRARRKGGLVYSIDNSIDEPLSESTVVIGKGPSKDSEGAPEQGADADEMPDVEHCNSEVEEEDEWNGKNETSVNELKPETGDQELKRSVSIKQQGPRIPKQQTFLSYEAYRSQLINAGLTTHVVKEQLKKMAAQNQSQKVQQKEHSNTASRGSTRKVVQPAGISLKSHRYAWPTRKISSSPNSNVTRSLGPTKSAKTPGKMPFPRSARTSRSWDRTSNNTNSSQQMLPIIGKKLHSRSKSTVN